jgi:hypothetical protein
LYQGTYLLVFKASHDFNLAATVRTQEQQMQGVKRCLSVGGEVWEVLMAVEA